MTDMVVRTRPSSSATTEAVSLETLESRCYAEENEMLQLAGRLSDRLRGALQRMKELGDALDDLVCRKGRMPIEEKTTRVLALIRNAPLCIDAAQAEQDARRITELKAAIHQYEVEVLTRLHASADR